MELKIILTFILGLATAYITFLNAERKISIENITKERAKWRDKIRELGNNVHKAIVEAKDTELAILRSQFHLLLNPTDKEDQKIIELISIKGVNEVEKHAEKFSICVSYLLKHDWERAKLESKPWYKCFNFQNINESEKTDSSKKYIKFIYYIFYHPKRKIIDSVSKKANNRIKSEFKPSASLQV